MRYKIIFDDTLKAICALGLLASLITGRSAMATTPYTQIIVFGDSLSDVGNFYRATQYAVPSDRYYSTNQSAGVGRFSNDTLWVEQVAALYRPSSVYPLLPNSMVSGLPMGTDYAWAYATVDNDVSITSPNSFIVPSVHNQVLQYLRDASNEADPNALFIVWAGMTDLINDVEKDQTAATIQTAPLAQHLINIIGILKAAGARNFYIPTVPDISYLPEIVRLGFANNAAGASADFNTSVTSDLVALSQAKGITVTRPDIYYLHRSIIESSNHLNFTDVTDSCVPTVLFKSPLCAPSVQPGYLYWDGRNFAAFANSLFASTVITTTPAVHTIPFP